MYSEIRKEGEGRRWKMVSEEYMNRKQPRSRAERD
jgi:hypothetical protein